jgi:hypothetical protein
MFNKQSKNVALSLASLLLGLILKVHASSAEVSDNVIDAQNFGKCVWDGAHDVAPCFQAAIDSASLNGRTVRLPHGTWPLGKALVLAANVTIVEPLAGNVSNPILLEGNVNAINVLVKKVIFDGGGTDFPNPRPIIKITNGKSVVLDGITVRNTRGIGAILQGNTSKSGVRNSQFVNVGNHWKTTLQRADRIQGLVFCCGRANRGNFAIGNRFEDIGLDALQISDQSNFVAKNNTFDLANDQRLRVKSPDYPAAIFTTNSSKVRIVRNVIHGAQGNGIDSPGLQHSEIEKNIVTDSGCAGIGLFQGYDKKTQTMDITVADNKIINNGHWPNCVFKGGITISGGGTPSNISIASNIVTDTQVKKTQSYGVQVRTRVLNLKIGPSNKLYGNRDADVDGASVSSSR